MIRKYIFPLFPPAFRRWVKRSSLRLIHLGNRYYCPVCQSNTRKQEPLGIDFPVIHQKQIIGGGKRNVLCPVCNSSDRTRLVYLFLKNKTNLFTKNTKLLHIAPEPQLTQIFRKIKTIDYLSADLMMERVMVKMDLTDIKYYDRSFDAIICNHVLEHIPDDMKAMRELFRVLKPGGWAILQVPISKTMTETFEDFSVTEPDEREKVFGQKDHVRIYGQDYVTRLETAGFRVKPFKWTEDHDIENKENKLNLNKEEVIFYCTKE